MTTTHPDAGATRKCVPIPSWWSGCAYQTLDGTAVDLYAGAIRLGSVHQHWPGCACHAGAAGVHSIAICARGHAWCITRATQADALQALTDHARKEHP